MKTIGPDFPLVPDAVILPFTLQRLYNNYMTALYTSDGDDADSIYECIKAFQIAGMELYEVEIRSKLGAWDLRFWDLFEILGFIWDVFEIFGFIWDVFEILRFIWDVFEILGLISCLDF